MVHLSSSMSSECMTIPFRRSSAQIASDDVDNDNNDVNDDDKKKG